MSLNFQFILFVFPTWIFINSTFVVQYSKWCTPCRICIYWFYLRRCCFLQTEIKWHKQLCFPMLLNYPITIFRLSRHQLEWLYTMCFLWKFWKCLFPKMEDPCCLEADTCNQKRFYCYCNFSFVPKWLQALGRCSKWAKALDFVLFHWDFC